MKIALCLIVKDEEKVLARCLQSFRNVVDEIHVADTGSSDKTVEIAKEYGALVKHYKEDWAIWGDSETILSVHKTKQEAEKLAKGGQEVRQAPLNYARARNFVQSDVKTDIIFSVDADEYLHPKCVENFRSSVLRYITTSNTILIPIYFGFDKDGQNPSNIHYLVRLFKKHCKWVGRIHEVIAYEKRVTAEDIILLHDKADKKQSPNKLPNYIATLKFEAQESPENPRPLFYLANTYFEHQRYVEAINIYERYFKITKWQDEKGQALLNLGKCFRDLNLNADAKSCLIRSAILNKDRAEPWFYLGDVTNRIDWAEACAYYEIATKYENKVPNTLMFIEPNCYSWLPWYRLSIGYDKLGDYFKGKKATENALKYIPENKDMLHNFDYYSKAQTINPRDSMQISDKPVNIIIPSATPELALKCIGSIFSAKTCVPYMISLVVNKSKAKEFPEFPRCVEVIEEDVTDFIYARAINRGITQTSDVVLLNDDTEVADYWLDDLQRVSRNESLGIVSPLISDVGNIKQHVSSKEESVWWKTEEKTLCFVCVYIPLEIIKQVGLLDEGYKWYGYEDDDFCIRVKNNSFDLKVCHTISIRHRRHSTFKESQQDLVHKAYEYHSKKWQDKSVKEIQPKTIYQTTLTPQIQQPRSMGQPVLTYEGSAPYIIGQVIFNTFQDSSPGRIIFGEGCEVRHGTYLEVANGTIRIGANSVIGASCFLQGNGDISIGEGTLIGPNCNIYSTYHPDTPALFIDAPLGKAKVTIGNNVWIGAGVTILHGVIIGDNSIIGANSLVNRDIPDGVVAFGTPARVHRRRNIPIERQTEKHIEKSHLERYKYVAQYLRHGDVVLDVGCGSGYGSQMLLDTKKCRVVAADISETAIARTEKIKRENLKVIHTDIMQFSSESYDKIIAFELVEHVEKDKELVAHLYDLLKPGGELFLSVPSNKVSASVNPYHYRHYSLSEFLDLIPEQKQDDSPRKIYSSSQVRGESLQRPPDEEADYFVIRVQKTDWPKRKVLFTAGVENTDRPERWEFVLNLFQDLAASFKMLNIDCLTLCHPVLKNRSINTLAANEDVLNKVMLDYNPDYVFVWNGNSDGDQKVIRAAEEVKAQMVYAELGWFPQKGHLHFDFQGVNAKSSLATAEFKPLTQEQQDELVKYKSEFKKEKASEYSSKQDHILIALQDERDSNIINSRFDSMYQFVEEALTFIRSAYPKDQHPDLKIKVRPHPHFKNVRLPESDDFEIDTDPIYKSIMEAKVVYAINSTVLLEAALLDKETMSYAPGLTYLHATRHLPDGQFTGSPSFRLDALLYHLIKRQLKWSDLTNLKVVSNYELFQKILEIA